MNNKNSYFLKIRLTDSLKMFLPIMFLFFFKSSQLHAQVDTIEKKQEGWKSPVLLKSVIQVLTPEKNEYRPHVPKNLIPDGATVFFPFQNAESVELEHTNGARITLFPGSLVTLSVQDILGQSRYARAAVDTLNLSQKSPLKEEKFLQKLLTFFSPRIPQELRDLPLKSTPSNSIVILSPGIVHLSEPDSLPTSIHFEWVVGAAQKEPHALYVWKEGTMAASPVQLARGGKASLLLPQYGRYFWQVEDASGRYLSAPRTIHVKKLAEPDENSDRQTASEGGVQGSFRLLFPDQKTVFAHCFSSGKFAEVPIRIPVVERSISFFKIEVTPSLAQTPDLVPVAEGNLVALGKAEISKPGNYRVRVMGKKAHSLGQQNVQKDFALTSDYSLIEIVDSCKGDPSPAADSGAEKIVDHIFSSLQNGKGFSSRGSIFIGVP